jgi:malonyl-CoA O-methyltransferase
MLDRARIGRSFHRKAETYDRLASVQQRVVRRLSGLLEQQMDTEPESVLDIGCGTGGLLAALIGRYPSARFCGLDLAFNMLRQADAKLDGDILLVNGDAERLPFRNASYDLVVSASTLQWLDPLDICLAECLRVVKGRGMVAVAFFGGRTLWELQECYCEAILSRSIRDDPRIRRLHRFVGLDEVQKAVSRLDVELLLSRSEIEMDYHPDVTSLLRSIKGIGAGTAAQGGVSGGLGWRGIIEDMSELYRDRFQTNGMIPATYEVLYLLLKPR